MRLGGFKDEETGLLDPGEMAESEGGGGFTAEYIRGWGGHVCKQERLGAGQALLEQENKFSSNESFSFLY